MKDLFIVEVLSSGFEYGLDGELYQIQEVVYSDGSTGKVYNDPTTLNFVSSQLGKRVDIDNLPNLGGGFD